LYRLLRGRDWLRARSCFAIPPPGKHIKEMSAANAKPSQSSLETAIPVLRKQWSRFPVKRAWVFGSRATAQGQTANDWDFLVEFSHSPSFDEFMGLKSGLEEELKAPVDLLSRSACPSRFLKAIEHDLIDVT
jgi:predicted nucleotidyltransferase